MKATVPSAAESQPPRHHKLKHRLERLRSPWSALTIGLLIGVIGTLVVRFVTYMPEMVHYHANFAVYINGQRDEFKGPQYYQSVSICSATTGVSFPEQRAHMHDNVDSVIHVHDHATTYGQFFENLGWNVGGDFIQTDDGTMYRADDTHKLHVIIDGQDYTDLTPITNMVIKDKSRLLLSFGDVSNDTLQTEYKSVPTTAAHYDMSMDPMSCAGMEKITLSERLHHLF